MLNDIRTLLSENGGLIFAGFLLVFFSFYGQSAVFGVYLPDIQRELSLSKSAVGTIYAIATILSGFLIIFTGKALDKYRLRSFLGITLAGLALGCFVLASATTVIMLLLAFFLLRQFGQGLMTHTANTAVNRYIDHGRGKAVSLIMLGGPLHAMILLPLALYMAQFWDWRSVWTGYGLFILLVLLPGFMFYMRKHQSTTHERWLRRVAAEAEQAQWAEEQEWTRRRVLGDWRFYALMLIFIIAPFVGTVVFFYQHEIADSLGLSTLAYATSFPFQMGAMIVASLASGYIIDKYGEKQIFVWFPLFYTAGLLLLTQGGGTLPVLYAGMTLLGVGNGMISTAGGPVIVLLYGTKHLGAVKALLFSVSILSSALSPMVFGLLMDAGHDIMTIFSWHIYYTAIVWVVALPVFATITNKKNKNKDKEQAS